MIFYFQAEATSMETFGSAISGTHNVKRVRFERKAIERDSDLALAHQSGHLTHSDVSAERQRVTRKSYSLYRHSAESVALLNRPSAVTVESGMDKFFQGGDSLAVKRNAFRVPQIYDSSLEDVRMKSHMTSTSLLPWSRVYKMTQFTEAVPSSPQTKIYGPYFLSDTNGRKDAPSEKYAVVESQHFVVRFAISSSSLLQTVFKPSLELPLINLSAVSLGWGVRSFMLVFNVFLF